MTPGALQLCPNIHSSLLAWRTRQAKTQTPDIIWKLLFDVFLLLIYFYFHLLHPHLHTCSRPEAKQLNKCVFKLCTQKQPILPDISELYQSRPVIPWFKHNRFSSNRLLGLLGHPQTPSVRAKVALGLCVCVWPWRWSIVAWLETAALM